MEINVGEKQRGGGFRELTGKSLVPKRCFLY